MLRILNLIFINILATLLMLFAVDQLLGMLGFPSDIPFQSAHKENAAKQHKNIEFEHQFTTNDQGLRYQRIPLDKPPGEVRILMLGDSFTEGRGVEVADTFGAYLENVYRDKSGPEIRFINAGLSGQGPIGYWRVFHNVGLNYDPDGLLICIYANDLTDTPESLTRAELRRRYPQRQGLGKAMHSLFPRIYTILSEAIRRFIRKREKSQGFVMMVSDVARVKGISEDAIERWRKGLPPALVEAANKEKFNGTLLSNGLLKPYYWTDSLDIGTPRAERKYLAMTLVLDEILGVARNKGIRVGLVYIPAPLQYDPTRYEDWNPWIIGGVEVRKQWAHNVSEIQKRLFDWARVEHVPFLDLTFALRAEIERGRVLNWKLDGHWNSEGHQVAGREIAEWMKNEGFIDVLIGAKSGS